MKNYLILIGLISIQLINAYGQGKPNPGHYANLESDFSSAELKAILATPGLKGVQLRYKWNSLEKSKGEYDFSKIASDLELVKKSKKHLIVFFLDKSFKGGVKFTPKYLWDGYTLPSGRSPNGEKGFVSKRYDDYVVQRIIELMDALAKKFDSDPWFEGIALQESAIGLSEGNIVKYGYTPEKYRDALIKTLIGVKKNFKFSQVFWYMNFLSGNQSYIPDIVTAVIPYNIIMGGPDILPDSKVLTNRVYPVYEQFKGQITAFCSVQYHSYCHPHADETYHTKFWTPEEIYLWARENLYIDYCFWNVPENTWEEDCYAWKDARPVILKYAEE